MFRAATWFYLQPIGTRQSSPLFVSFILSSLSCLCAQECACVLRNSSAALFLVLLGQGAGLGLSTATGIGAPKPLFKNTGWFPRAHHLQLPKLKNSENPSGPLPSLSSPASTLSCRAGHPCPPKAREVCSPLPWHSCISLLLQGTAAAVTSGLVMSSSASGSFLTNEVPSVSCVPVGSLALLVLGQPAQIRPLTHVPTCCQLPGPC